MEIEISKYNGKDQKNTSKYYQLLDIKVVNHSTSLLLIQKSQMGVGNGKEKEQSDFLQITKVQFIAACKIEIAAYILVAFYLGESGELSPFVMSELPAHYFQESVEGIIIDYKSYLEICEITQEKKLSIYEYYQHMKDGDQSLNSIMIYHDKVLNYDAQIDFWVEHDNKK